MNIWAFANQKGGVGKTTSAITLAGILAARNEKTLMIDLDPHASMSSYFGMEPETINNGVFELFIGHSENKNIDLNSVVHTTEIEHLSIIPSSVAVATLEKRFGTNNGMGLILSSVLKNATQQYKHVLIDCPPVLGLLMLNAMVACDQLVVPVQTELLAIKGLHRMLRTIEMIENSLHKKIIYTVLPTMYDKRTLASQKSLQILKDECKGFLSAEPIPIDTKFRDASFTGKPISFTNKNTHGLKAYKTLLQQMLPAINDEAIDNKAIDNNAANNKNRDAA
ncbi:ParA-like protein [hydrothermal vent metagenome]|uniref:ParA-like protein n=1 Tax=hydrothermal vent metagenome TaxID=652676 RepID=A0A3B0W5P6_9ZZZZ